jgi:sialic acid synthase SpsE
MIDAIKAIDTGKHSVILKWQLSLPDGINVPLEHDVFDYAYHYAASLGYETTSSVADLESLKFLLQYDIPFVKLPNCRELDWLIGEIPRKIPVYVSYGSEAELNTASNDIQPLICVSEYPTTIEQYETTFSNKSSFALSAISDHTTNFCLWYRYQPKIIEWHFRLEDSTGLDAGSFARTPLILQEVL